VEREGEAAGRAVALFVWGVWNLGTTHLSDLPWVMIRVAL